jgi:hypothetical protein
VELTSSQIRVKYPSYFLVGINKGMKITGSYLRALLAKLTEVV